MEKIDNMGQMVSYSDDETDQSAYKWQCSPRCW